MTRDELLTHRKARLERLILDAGSQVAVARKIATDPAYISQIVGRKGRRNIGNGLARRLERGFGKPLGWMDNPSQDDHPRSSLQEPRDWSAFAMIPRYEALASLGPGEVAPEGDQIKGHLAFKHVWLEKRRLNPRFLTVIEAVGDSMHPTISDGDVLLVDLRQKEPMDNRIFVLRLEDQLFAKRLHTRPNCEVEVYSDNPAAKPFAIGPEREQGVDIIGRVVWAGRDM